ncbi:MAG TPA: molybdopterin oxidoreductase [Polyangiaceae bacterium]|nr:molybdopterin oxidoreductase [Polyangiaceae bacterium]
MLEKPSFIQGVFAFEGRGLERPTALRPDVGYSVPPDRRAQLIYLRAGNPAPELIYLLIHLNGRPLRYFPVGAKAGLHIPLAIVEDLPPEGRLEVLVGAPEGLRGSVLVDIGLLEI